MAKAMANIALHMAKRIKYSTTHARSNSFMKCASPPLVMLSLKNFNFKTAHISLMVKNSVLV